MTMNKCPFSAIQAAGTAACDLAQEVVRKGGSEFDCTDPNARPVCVALSAHLIRVGFDALDLVDDLGVTPKSAYDRAQIGGLQGLNTLLPAPAGDQPLQNLWALTGAVDRRYADILDIPDAPVVEAIRACKPSRRRRQSR
jgi:hypothetical protein